MPFIFRAASLAAKSTDGLNPTEGVRYIRRRKFGQKRRSIIVKRRTPINNKANKNESMITHDDSCTTDIITNDNDEHSQEYKPRRPKLIINESIKEEEEGEEENIIIPRIPSPKLPIKLSTFKQLKLDQFLKVVQPVVNPSLDQRSESNHIPLSNSDIQNDNNNEVHIETRRITRNTRLHSTSTSETDPIKTDNKISSETSNKSDGTY
jgi:hypothetical protein